MTSDATKRDAMTSGVTNHGSDGELKVGPPRPRRRRSQEERSAETQRRILDATIKCLVEEGLAGTTTVKVVEMSSTSRGGMLHHFGSRNELLIAAVRHLAVERFRQLPAKVTPGAFGPDRIEQVIRLLWSLYDGPLFWAAMELWIGARSDPDLREALAPEERQLGLLVRDMSDELFGPEITVKPAYFGVREAIVASMRGTAMLYAFDERRVHATESHVAYWVHIATELLGDCDRCGHSEADDA